MIALGLLTAAVAQALLGAAILGSAPVDLRYLAVTCMVGLGANALVYVGADRRRLAT